MDACRSGGALCCDVVADGREARRQRSNIIKGTATARSRTVGLTEQSDAMSVAEGTAARTEAPRRSWCPSAWTRSGGRPRRRCDARRRGRSTARTSRRSGGRPRRTATGGDDDANNDHDPGSIELRRLARAIRVRRAGGHPVRKRRRVRVRDHVPVHAREERRRKRRWRSWRRTAARTRSTR